MEILEFPNLTCMTSVFYFLQFTLKPSITDDFSIRVGIKLYNHEVCTVYVLTIGGFSNNFYA